MGAQLERLALVAVALRSAAVVAATVELDDQPELRPIAVRLFPMDRGVDLRQRDA